jgi:hypothetical protein
MSKGRRKRRRPTPDSHLLYFDSNIYSLIARQGSLPEVKRLLKVRDLAVLGSLFNLFEAFRIEDPDERAVRVTTISKLARTHEREPQTYLQAMELLNEIRRNRERWLNRSPDLRPSKFYLKAARNHWPAIAADPYYLPENADYYRWSSRLGTKLKKENQGELRSAQIRGGFLTAEGGRVSLPAYPGFQQYLDAMPFLDGWWRARSAGIWYGALEGYPFSADMRDWLDPHVVFKAVDYDEWLEFWIRGVDPKRMIRGWLSFLTDYYQTHHKITSGNATDIGHAGYLLDVDLFLTADKAFFDVLTTLAEKHFPDAAVPVLVNDGNLVSAIEHGLEGLDQSNTPQRALPRGASHRS